MPDEHRPVVPAAATDAPTTTRRTWLLRALFESGLILFGLLGAFALNEWQEARQREARVEALLTAITAELQANLELQQDAATYNTNLVDALRKLRDEGATIVPPSVYPRGLIIVPPLTSAAWDAAQEGGLLNEIPIETVLVLASIYESQRNHVDSTAALFNAMYAAYMSAPPGPQSGAVDPRTAAGVLNDFARRGARLVEHYQAGLEHMRAHVEPD